MRIIRADSVALIAVLQDTLVLGWRSHCAVDACAQVAEELSHMSHGYLLTHVPPSTATPTEEERHALIALLRAGNGRLEASAVAYTGGRLRAYIARTVALMLAASARLTYEHRPVGDLDSAVTWLQLHRSRITTERATSALTVTT